MIYPHNPGRFDRRVLAVLAAAHISPPELPYNGFLVVDVASRMPNRCTPYRAGQALLALESAGYAHQRSTRLVDRPGIFPVWFITSNGMRVVLGVLS